MSTGLNTGFRFKIAVALSAFATVCFVLLPSATQAFASSADMLECLFHAETVDPGTGDLHHGTKVHDIALPELHHQDDDAPGPVGHEADCCDLFCASALLIDDGDVADRDITARSHFPAREPRLLSRLPELPDRPPNSLLVV